MTPDHFIISRGMPVTKKRAFRPERPRIFGFQCFISMFKKAKKAKMTISLPTWFRQVHLDRKKIGFSHTRPTRGLGGEMVTKYHFTFFWVHSRAFRCPSGDVLGKHMEPFWRLHSTSNRLGSHIPRHHRWFHVVNFI